MSRGYSQDQGQGQGQGSVTTVSVVSTNGLSGNVDNPTTTPAITLSTSASGVLKGSSGALTPATASDIVTTLGATSTPTANASVLWDANKNLNANNLINSVTSTVASATIVTLTVASKGIQRFTGTTTQTVVLPNATTLNNGTQYFFQNESTGALTIQMNGGTTLLTIPANSDNDITLNSNTTSAGIWHKGAVSGGGSGTVTSVSVTSANGLSGTVATPTTTPAITLSTSASGVLKGSSGSLVPAIAGTDYLAPALTSANLLVGNSSNIATGVALSGDATITNAGVLTVGANAITNTKLNTAGANTYKGNSTAATANVSDIATNTAFNQNFETSTANIKMNGTVSLGTLSTIARADHTHPSDTSRQAQITASGLLKGAGGGSISAATAGTDYLAPALTSANLLVGNSSNIATGVALSGDATIDNTGALTIGANKVSNTKLAQMSTKTIKGNDTESTSNASDLTATQVTAMLNTMAGDSGSGGTKGLVPAPASGDSSAGKFLKADGTWTVPSGSGSGTVSSVSVVSANGLSGTVANPTTTPAITLSTSASGILKGSSGSISAATAGTDYLAPALTSANLLVGNSSNIATGVALSGDATIDNTGALTIGANKVSNTKLAQMSTKTIKGNDTESTSNASDLTATQVTAMLNTMAGDSGSGGTKGLVPAPASGDSSAGKFLKADGTWTVPSGSGSGTVNSVSVVSANGLSGTVANPTTTPAITLSTSASGILKGSSGSISAATASDVITTLGATSTPTAGTSILWDANKNLNANNLIKGITTTATSATAIVLYPSSTGIQVYTGSSNQTVVLPYANVLSNGTQYFFQNESSGELTIKNAVASILTTIPANSENSVTLYNNTTAAGAWHLGIVNSGTVSSVSVVSANGLSGTVANPTTTPAITLSTSASGILKGSSGSISAATAGTDYSSGTKALSTGILKSTTGTGNLTIASASDIVSTLGSTFSPTASTSVLWDANSNLRANNLINGITSTITSTTPITLTATSTGIQRFTGSIAQTVILPDATTLINGTKYLFQNETVVTLTIKNANSTTVTTIPANSDNYIVLSLASSSAGTWHVGTTTGTVTSVSVVSANGLSGTVANPTTTPAITLSTPASGILKGSSGSISAATVGTDYSAGTSSLSTGILKSITGIGALTIASASDIVSTLGATSTPTPSTSVLWDSNSNLRTNNLINGITSTVTSTTTITLTATSTGIQRFTGSIAQTVILPNPLLLNIGTQYFFQNESTAQLTIQANGGFSFFTIPANSDNYVTLVSTNLFGWHVGTNTGTVSSVSVVSANGLSGTVANPTTTPAITLSTSASGILKGSSGSLSSASSGVDYSAGTSTLITGILKSTTSTGDLSIATAGTDYLAPALTSANVFVGNSSNVATGVALSGDATIDNTGALTIGANKVSNTKLAQMSTKTIKGNDTGSTSNASDLTATQVTAMLNTMAGDSGSGGTKGLVPAPASGDSSAGKFLKADGTWTIPTGTVSSVSVVSANGLSGTVANPTTTPAITLSTSASGILKGSSGSLSSASSGVDYSAGTSTLITGILKSTTSTGALSIATAGTDYLAPALTSANVFVGNSSNVATGVALSGDATIDNTGALTIGANKVSNTKLAQMSTKTIKGNDTGSTSNASDLTATQVTAMLNTMAGDSGSGGTKGLVPAPASGDSSAGKFLKADGTWTIPTGTVSSVSVVSANGLSGTVANPTTTPAITLSTSASGILKGSSGSLSSASSGVDYSAGTSTLITGILKSTTSTGALSIATAGTDYLAPDLTSANVFVGNSSNVATGVALSGDATIDNTGALTIGANKVSNTKLAQMSTKTIKGNDTESTSNASDLTATQVTAMLNTMAGDSGSGGTKGLVPAPATGDGVANKYLDAKGEWSIPAGGSVIESQYIRIIPASGVNTWDANRRMRVSQVVETLGNNITLFSTGIIRLLSAGTYELTAVWQGSAGGGGGIIRWYNETSGAFVGQESTICPPDSGNTITPNSVLYHTITITSPTNFSIREIGNGNMQPSGASSYVIARQLNVPTPTTVNNVPIGTVIQNVSPTINGYLLCNGTSYNRADYSALFNLLNVQQGTVTLTIATPCVVTRADHGLTTGQKVYFTTTGALPTGLTANTTYWINVTGVNTFNVATSYANLIAGTYIATTGTQSGVHTVYLTIGNVTNATTFNVPDYQGKVLANTITSHGIGKFIGAETHTLTIAQMPTHNHSIQGYVYNDYDANDVFSNRQGLDTGSSQYNTNSVGGGLAHNNMQPTEFIYFHIKF